MNLFDVSVGVAGLFAVYGGYRMGFLTRTLSWFGLLAGVFIVSRLALPMVLDHTTGIDPAGAAVAVSAVLLFGAIVGTAIGLALGTKLRRSLASENSQIWDRLAGAMTSVVGLLVAVWMLVPVLANVPGQIAAEVRNSDTALFLDENLPHPPDGLAALRLLLRDDRYPQVFESLRPTPDIVAPPEVAGFAPDVVQRVIESTVRVSGKACNRIQLGSGFVVGDDVVVTNAHVVAGGTSIQLERSDGSSVDAQIVAFDPRRDLAVLFAPGLDRPELAVEQESPGATGGVFGHPGGGQLRVAPFQISEQIAANGSDIYDRESTRRDVLIVAANLAQGDSGAALVDTRGVVVGVAFAIAPDNPNVAYALDVSELQDVLAGDLSQPVDSGRCLH